MGKVEERIVKAKERYERLKSSKNKGFITKDEQLILEEGTLIHGTSFDETVLKSIAQKGLVGANFTGFINPDSNEKFPNGVNFFRVPVKCFMKEYFEFYSNTKIDSLGKAKPIKSMKEIQKTDGIPTRSLRYRKEYDFLPRRWSNNRGTWKKDMAFIVNPSSEIQALRNDDPYQTGESELFDKYKGYDDDFKNMKNRVGNILYGIPTSQISGILISPDFEQEIQQIEFLKKTFPDVYITTTEGKVIYRGLEKEEKNNEQNNEVSGDKEIRRNVFNPFNVISSSNMQRNIKLGNSGEMHRYLAADGSKYLIKPAYKKGTKQQETFRAVVQRAAYEVQRMIDPSSAVACNVKKLNIDGQEIFGTVQEEIQGTNFDDIPGVPSEKFQKYGSQFLREFVTDYLLCNYDSHSGNFIVDNNGLLRGIDKEQSFKFIMEDSNEKIDLNYAPNGLLHQPIYNKLFKMYEKGKIDLNLEEIFTYLDRIEKIPDELYMSKFKLYASSKANNPEEEKEILERILSRKQNARNNIKEFLINIKIQRKANELGITPEEVREKLLKKRQSPIPIASEVKNSARKIASTETARGVQATHGEIKSDYLELENPTQTKENIVSIDE